MNTESIHIDTREDDVIVLGIASTETKGGPLAGEDIGGPNFVGISEE